MTTDVDASEEEPQEASEGPLQEETRVEESVRFYDGDYLSLADTRGVTRAYPSKVILVAGPAASGKTTLLASIYNKFQRGPFASLVFAGSRSLIAYERICFPGRLASDRDAEETSRTPRANQPNFLHLGVRKQDLTSSRIDLLFPDVSGEIFAEMESSNDACRELTLLTRADAVAIVVDAGRLADGGRRQSARVSVDNFLRRCIEVGVIDTHTHVDIVISKWDLFASSESNESFLNNMLATLNDRYSHRVAKLHEFKVAARPRDPSDLPLAFGVDDLLTDWTTTTPPSKPTDAPPPIHMRPFDRFSDALRLRRE